MTLEQFITYNLKIKGNTTFPILLIEASIIPIETMIMIRYLMYNKHLEEALWIDYIFLGQSGWEWVHITYQNINHKDFSWTSITKIFFRAIWVKMSVYHISKHQPQRFLKKPIWLRFFVIDFIKEKDMVY